MKSNYNVQPSTNAFLIIHMKISNYFILASIYYLYLIFKLNIRYVFPKKFTRRHIIVFYNPEGIQSTKRSHEFVR